MATPDELASDVVRECSHHVPGVAPALQMGENARACAACIADAIRNTRISDLQQEAAIQEKRDLIADEQGLRVYAADEKERLAIIERWIASERALRTAMTAWRDGASTKEEALAAFEATLKAMGEARVALQSFGLCP